MQVPSANNDKSLSVITPIGLLDIPPEIRYEYIWSQLNPFHLSQCIMVCKDFQRECSSDKVWMRHLKDAVIRLTDPKNRCRAFKPHHLINPNTENKPWDDGPYDAQMQYKIIFLKSPIDKLSLYSTKTGLVSSCASEYCIHLSTDPQVTHPKGFCGNRIGTVTTEYREKHECDLFKVNIAGFGFEVNNLHSGTLTTILRKFIRNLNRQVFLPLEATIPYVSWKCHCGKIHGPGVPFYQTIPVYSCCTHCKDPFKKGPGDMTNAHACCYGCINLCKAEQELQIFAKYCQECKDRFKFKRLTSNTTGITPKIPLPTAVKPKVTKEVRRKRILQELEQGLERELVAKKDVNFIEKRRKTEGSEPLVVEEWEWFDSQ